MALTAIAGPTQRVTGGNLDQDDPDAVGVPDPHLGADIPDLDPDHLRPPGKTGRAAGDLEESRAEKERHAGIVRRAEFRQMARARTSR